jgi:tripartite-type tricarboxylate transporter receptor subunit TctC
LCALATVAAASLPAAAQGYPSRPVTLIVPFTPGTGIDIIARTLGQRLGEKWGQGFVVDNRAGASGNIGAGAVAKAAPDGYTLMVTATSLVTNAAVNKSVPYDPLKSFEPVSLVATGIMSLLVSNNAPAQTVQELVSYAKQRPGELTYASSGNGTPQHLSMELFKLEAGVDLTHVPYKGSAGAIMDTVAGRVNAMFIPIHTAQPFLQRKQLRMLAIVAPERSPVVPDVPTMKEAGFPGIQIENWYGVLAPAGTPAAIVARLNAEINAQLASPQVNAILAKEGLNPVGGTPARLTELIKAEQQRWQRVVSAARITAD